MRRALLFAPLVALAGCAGMEPEGRILTRPEALRLEPPARPDLARLRAELAGRPTPRPTAVRLLRRPLAALPYLSRRSRADVEALGRTRGRPAEALVLAAGSGELRALAARFGDPRLACRKRRCRLAAPLFVAAGAVLVVREVELVLEAQGGALLAVAGRLVVDRARIRGVEGGAPARFRDPDRFRPFIAVYEGGSAFIRESALEHLGYAAPLAYGLSFGRAVRDPPNARPPPTGAIFRSRLEGLYYAFYSHQAEGVVILDNRVEDSIRYGIDPHDDSRRLVIAGNLVTGTRERHGIILSRRVTDSWILDNISIDNGTSGIVLDRWSGDHLVAGNLVRGNRGDGIAVYESDRLWLVANRVEDNGRVGVRVRNSRGVMLIANRIRNNRTYGLLAYTGEAPGREVEAPVVRRTSLGLRDNLWTGNGKAELALRGAVTALLLQAAPRRHPLSGSLHPPRLRAPAPWRRALESLPPGFSGRLTTAP